MANSFDVRMSKEECERFERVLEAVLSDEVHSLMGDDLEFVRNTLEGFKTMRITGEPMKW